MIKEQGGATPSNKSTASKPILIIKSKASTKRGDSAKPRVTFSENTFVKESITSKDITPVQGGKPVAANMTFGQFEALVKRRLEGGHKVDAPSATYSRPQSVKLSANGECYSDRKVNELRATFSYQRPDRIRSSQFSQRSSFFQPGVSRVHQNDSVGLKMMNCIEKERTGFRTYSKSFRDSLSKDFKIGSFGPSPPKAMARIRSTGKLAFSNLPDENTESIVDLGISPEVERRSSQFLILDPQLTKSLMKLKKIGFPEKNLKALVFYANQNDRQLIKGVSRVAQTDPDQVVGNIEALLYERKQVEAIDQWEDFQKSKLKIKSAFEGRPRLGTAG